MLRNRRLGKRDSPRPPLSIACAVLIAALAGTPAVGVAQEIPVAASSTGTVQEQAKARFDEGSEHYDRREFRAAADSFRAAYALFPEPAFLYNLAQAERLDGQCDSALTHYEEFSKSYKGTMPSDLDQKIAEMRHCRDATRHDKDVGPVAPKKQELPAGPAVAIKSPEPQSAPSSSKHGTSQIFAFAAFGGALVSAALGAVYVAQANDAKSHLAEVNRPGAEWGPRYDSYQASLDRSENAAIGFFVASGVLTGLGLWLALGPPASSTKSRARVEVDFRVGLRGAQSTIRF